MTLSCCSTITGADSAACVVACPGICLLNLPLLPHSTSRCKPARTAEQLAEAQPHAVECLFVDLMNRPTAVDVSRLSVPLVLGWLCALSPFVVLFVVGTAWLHQQSGWRTAFGPFADHYRAVMLPVLNVAWSLSMMFAVYAA